MRYSILAILSESRGRVVDTDDGVGWFIGISKLSELLICQQL
jgi:hypothetical protein